MTTREEIIALAEHNGIYYRATPLGTSEMFCYDSSLEAFHPLRYDSPLIE